MVKESDSWHADSRRSLREFQSNIIIWCDKSNNNAHFRASFNLNILMISTICNAFQIDANIFLRMQIQRGVTLG